MIPPIALIALAAGAFLALLVLLVAKPSITRDTGGKILAFLAIFVAPGVAMTGGGWEHLELSTSTKFCLSCHVMEKYGKSLLVDDSEYIPAVHYQNNYVPRDNACYTCHTDYAMYGTILSKLRGIRHVMVQYFGTVPDTVKLYAPYKNRECLHCHLGARKFEEASAHKEDEWLLTELKRGEKSCMEAGCHDAAHEVNELAEAKFWKGVKE